MAVKGPSRWGAVLPHSPRSRTQRKWLAFSLILVAAFSIVVFLEVCRPCFSEDVPQDSLAKHFVIVDSLDVSHRRAAHSTVAETEASDLGNRGLADKGSPAEEAKPVSSGADSAAAPAGAPEGLVSGPAEARQNNAGKLSETASAASSDVVPQASDGPQQSPQVLPPPVVGVTDGPVAWPATASNAESPLESLALGSAAAGSSHQPQDSAAGQETAQAGQAAEPAAAEHAAETTLARGDVSGAGVEVPPKADDSQASSGAAAAPAEPAGDNGKTTGHAVPAVAPKHVLPKCPKSTAVHPAVLEANAVGRWPSDGFHDGSAAGGAAAEASKSGRAAARGQSSFEGFGRYWDPNADARQYGVLDSWHLGPLPHSPLSGPDLDHSKAWRGAAVDVRPVYLPAEYALAGARGASNANGNSASNGAPVSGPAPAVDLYSAKILGGALPVSKSRSGRTDQDVNDRRGRHRMCLEMEGAKGKAMRSASNGKVDIPSLPLQNMLTQRAVIYAHGFMLNAKLRQLMIDVSNMFGLNAKDLGVDTSMRRGTGSANGDATSSTDGQPQAQSSGPTEALQASMPSTLPYGLPIAPSTFYHGPWIEDHWIGTFHRPVVRAMDWNLYQAIEVELKTLAKGDGVDMPEAFANSIYADLLVPLDHATGQAIPPSMRATAGPYIGGPPEGPGEQLVDVRLPYDAELFHPWVPMFVPYMNLLTMLQDVTGAEHAARKQMEALLRWMDGGAEGPFPSHDDEQTPKGTWTPDAGGGGGGGDDEAAAGAHRAAGRRLQGSDDSVHAATAGRALHGGPSSLNTGGHTKHDLFGPPGTSAARDPAYQHYANERGSTGEGEDSGATDAESQRAPRSLTSGLADVNIIAGQQSETTRRADSYARWQAQKQKAQEDFSVTQSTQAANAGGNAQSNGEAAPAGGNPALRSTGDGGARLRGTNSAGAARVMTAEKPARPSSNDVLCMYTEQLSRMVRPDVQYVTLTQRAGGPWIMEYKWTSSCARSLYGLLQNVMVISAGGIGHVPIPLLGQERPFLQCSADHMGYGPGSATHSIAFVGSPRAGPRDLALKRASTRPYPALIASDENLKALVREWDAPRWADRSKALFDAWGLSASEINKTAALPWGTGLGQKTAKEPLEGQLLPHGADVDKPLTAKDLTDHLWMRAMASGLLQLAPRGTGPTSFRLYEALQMGLVPVYIHNNGPWLPYLKRGQAIDWVDGLPEDQQSLWARIAIVKNVGAFAYWMDADEPQGPNAESGRDALAIFGGRNTDPTQGGDAPNRILQRMRLSAAAVRDRYFTYDGVVRRIAEFLDDPFTAELDCMGASFI